MHVASRRLLAALAVAAAAVPAGCASAGERRDLGPPVAAAESRNGVPEVRFDADLVIFGRVRTLDPRRPDGEAVVVLGDRIERVADRAEAERRIGPKTRVIRAPAEAVILPGLYESHAHLRATGRSLREVDLAGTRSAEEAVARAVGAAADLAAGRWLLGRGWNQERWDAPRWPTAADLDAAFPDRPVALSRADGHAVWVNGAALRLARIDASTPDPDGGEILRDASGAPTGVLIDRAADLVMRFAEARTDPAQAEDDFLRGQAEAFRQGITTFVDAGENQAGLLALLRLCDAGRLKLRVYAMAEVSTAAELVDALARPVVTEHGGRLTLRALKLYADGALGSRGAALLEPYADRADARGLDLASPDFLRKVAARCLERGRQLCVHAIGDRANRAVLDAVEAAAASRPATDHRFRIEHAQHVDPRDVPRFRRLGVIASVQPCHATSDWPWARARLGDERLERTGYRWRSLLDAGARLCLGTDAPVEPLSPLANLYAAVTRRDPQRRSAEAFDPTQALNREEAVRGLTTWAAYATFTENVRGRLAPGFVADLCVLSVDPMTCAPEALLDARCLLTVVAGEIVHDAASR
ncbi:MAG TPA: amidohydrolase [Planctomycetota bacterium]|nr:amidohydrolase [Planctomycetota bacterium]